MVSEAPPFWWSKADWRAWTLYPISFLYGRIAGYRMANAKRASVPVPVICVGNFTVGGAGKTPTALTIARAAKAKGPEPRFPEPRLWRFARRHDGRRSGASPCTSGR